MFRIVRRALYYGLFAAMSLAIHVYLLWPADRVPDSKTLLDLARQIQLDLAQIEQRVPPEPVPRPPKEDPPTPVKYKETTKQEKEAAPEPVAQAAPDPPEPAEKRREAAPPEPAPEKPDDAPQPKADIASLSEYRRFLAREMKREGADDRYIPKLRFGDNTADDNREVMRYFGMELIAYPKDQKFFVTIDPDRGVYHRSNDFDYIRAFSNRVIFRSSPCFDGLRREAARRAGVDADSLLVAQLLKPASAAYIAWKETESARRAGVPIEEVEACDAQFVKSPFGAWIVRIDALALKGGRTVRVQDFEWSRVCGSNGGGR